MERVCMRIPGVLEAYILSQKQQSNSLPSHSLISITIYDRTLAGIPNNHGLGGLPTMVAIGAFMALRRLDPAFSRCSEFIVI